MELAAPESNGRSERTETLYREHGAAVAAFCRSRLRDRGDAEDATQQVFLSAHRALLNGTVPREPLAWLLAVARHECYARFRQRATAPLPAGAAPEGATADASVHVLRAGELASMWDEVERMPPAQRNAFLLREIRGLSYGQLAAELSLSPPSVRSLLLRARTRLRSRLGDVAAGFGGVPWVQALLRLAGGGEGASSPVPAATKALAVGVGALALVGGGDVPRLAHNAASTPARPAAHHRSAGHEQRAAAAPAVVAAVERNNRPRLEDVAGERSRGHGGGDRPSTHSGPGPSGSHEGGDVSNTTISDGGSATGGDHGASDTTVTTTVAQPTSSEDGGPDGGSTSSGSSTGSDGGPSSVTTSSSSDGGPGPSSATTSSSSDGGSEPSSATISSGSDGGSGSDDGSSAHGG